jgi:flagellar hook-basal body complex protein FliE
VSSIQQIQQDMLGRMQQMQSLAAQGPVRPAMQMSGPAAGGVTEAFGQALKAVDAQQHLASQATAAVDSGRSSDLVGAMLESQKASVSFSALLQVRNKLSTAFDDIMRTPL